LAASIAGFKHDEVTDGVDADRFQQLRPGPTGLLARPARPWWKFW
jgi:hypothetical protein